MRSVNEIINYVLDAEDGEIGRCKDFLFDDRHFAVRYIVADTGKWLPGKKVLISPITIDEPDESEKKLPTDKKKPPAVQDVAGLQGTARHSRL